MTEKLITSGGFIAPYANPFSGPVQVTYRVRGWWRRWRLRRQGWSTEWTVEYDGRPLFEALPRFTAVRGGVSFK